MSKGKFGTAINCMDGRVQLPVIEWMKTNFGLDYIDMVTEPGPDGIIANGQSRSVESIKSRVLISVKAHGSDVVVIVGHYDCAGNPVAEEEHWSHLGKAIGVIRSWDLSVSKIVGVWVGENWGVELVDVSN